MTQVALIESLPELPAGEARFITAAEAKVLQQISDRDHYITVQLPELRSALRGRLDWLFEEAIEQSLELRGACTSVLKGPLSLEAKLTDQLYRARLIGARGLTLILPTLEDVTSRCGALDADDSSTLRFWIAASRTQPVRLYLDLADCMLGAYLDPVTLTHLMHAETPVRPNGPPLVVEWVDRDQTVASTEATRERKGPEMLASATSTPPISDVVASVHDSGPGLTEPHSEPTEASALSIPPPTKTALDSALPSPSLPPGPTSIPPETVLDNPSFDLSLVPPSAPMDTSRLAEFAETLEAEDTSLTPIAAPALLDLQLSCSLASETAQFEGSQTFPTMAPPAPESSEAVSAEFPVTTSACDEVNHVNADVEPQAPNPPLLHPPTMPAPAPAAARDETPANPASPPAQCLALHSDAEVSWRAWMQRLDAAHGPKPLNFIEQAFVNAYIPLADAYHRKIAGEECRRVLEQWACSFSQSYSEAFDAMRIRGRRPMMVLDIVETAQRLSRLHGARSVQLILVDGMRYDLGLRVERLLSARLNREATLTDRFLLWSALPTTTTQQLELIARGPEGLRDGDVHSDTPVLVARGRAASTLRRIRVGSRELLKLDLVEARLGEAG
ncbi:MAG TPA: hypothetical protein VKP30_19490, partial [Polyangiaceae bacterium]|nr:hypothetical protein [Polyangiaceae bacterium]